MFKARDEICEAFIPWRILSGIVHILKKWGLNLSTRKDKCLQNRLIGENVHGVSTLFLTH